MNSTKNAEAPFLLGSKIVSLLSYIPQSVKLGQPLQKRETTFGNETSDFSNDELKEEKKILKIRLGV